MTSLASRAVCAALFVATVACNNVPRSAPVPVAPPAPPLDVGLMLAGIGAPIAAQPTRYVVASWPAACDARGCADTYRVVWTVRGQSSAFVETVSVRDSVSLPTPVFPDTSWVQVTVTPVRRSLVGPSTSSRVLVVRSTDVPPPRVDSIALDTLPAGVDVELEGLTIGQAVWSDSGPHRVSLVAGKDATVRVWVRGDAVAAPRVSVHVDHADGSRDTLPVLRAQRVWHRDSVARAPLAASYRALVPGRLVREGMRVQAFVRVADASMANNAATITPPTLAVPPLRVHLVPVTIDSLTSRITPAMRADAKAWAERIWPLADVEVTVHDTAVRSRAPKLVSNDRNGGWLVALGEMNVLRTREAFPVHVYVVGVLPVTYGGGVAGYAFVPGRAMTVWDKGSWGRVFAHELGHNLGRRHVAACGSGNVDTNYPYAGGRVGVHGLASGSFITPTSHTDIMGYCGTQHVSDYTYSAVMRYRGAAQPFLAFFASTQQERVVVVSAIVRPEAVSVTATWGTTVPEVPSGGPFVLSLYEGSTLVRELAVRGAAVDHGDAVIVTAAIPTTRPLTHITLTRRDGGAPIVTRAAITEAS